MIGRTNSGKGKEKEEQIKSIAITTNGTYNVVPDTNKVLSRVTANVNIIPTINNISSIRDFKYGSAYNVTHTNTVPNTIIHITASRFGDTTHPITCSVSGASVMEQRAFYSSSCSNYDGWFLINSSSVSISVSHFNTSSLSTFIN